MEIIMNIPYILEIELNTVANKPLYFMKRYINSMPCMQDFDHMEIRDLQVEFVSHVSQNRLSCISAGRQSGKTLTSMAYALWKAVVSEQPINIYLIFGRSQMLLSSSENMEYMIRMLPNFMINSIESHTYSNKWTINKSKLTFVQASSFGLNDLDHTTQEELYIFDEYAYFPDNFDTSVIDQIAIRHSNASIVLISSESDRPNDFHQRMNPVPVRFEPHNI